MVGSRDHRTHIWKGAIQESFQQSLVEIGSVVSEEKIFLKFHPPFFLICIIGQNILKGTHPGTIPARLGLTWFSGFRGEDLNVKVSDVQRMPKAHMAFGQVS